MLGLEHSVRMVYDVIIYEQNTCHCYIIALTFYLEVAAETTLLLFTSPAVECLRDHRNGHD